MWRLTTLCLLALLLSVSVFGQSTTVSGTITDNPDGQAWFNGTYSFVFRPSPTNPIGPYFWNGAPFSTSQTIAGGLDASAHYSVSVPSNTAITPAGSTWDVTFCPLATAECVITRSVTITGATQTFAPSPPSIRINLAVPLQNPRGYTDTEMVNGALGQTYYNIVDTTTHLCNATPCGWSSGGGGGSPSFAAITSGTAVGRHFTVGNGTILDTTGSGVINATTVPWAGVSSLPANCTSGQFMIGLASVTLPCSTVNFSQLVGLIATTQIPGGTGCPANQYANGLNAALALACAQISYGQITGTPTLAYQTLKVNGIAQTARPTWNLINGANCTIANNDNGIANQSDISFTCTGGSGGGSVGGQGVFQMVGVSPGSFAAAPQFVDVFNVLRTTVTQYNCGPEPNSNIYCYGAFISYSNTTGTITGTTNSLSIPGPASFKTGEYLIVVGAGATSSIGTPTGISITPVTGGGGDNAVAQTGGSVAAGVCIVAVGKDNQASPCSAVATTAIAQASLGQQTATISSFTRSNNVVTVACSSACVMPTGTSAYLNYFGNSDRALAGWFSITRIDDTHFTFNQNLDTRAGAPIAPATLSSPTVSWFQKLRYAWSAVAGAKYYEVYGGTGCVSAATCTLVAYADAGRLHYDDEGATMEANKVFHPWTPTSGPTSARNGNLSCKIGAGGGTTTLTLVNPNGTNCNAGNTVTAAITLSDDGPPLILAAQGAGAVTNTGGPITRIPSPPFCSGPCTLAFPVINSYTDLTALSSFNSNGVNLEIGGTTLILHDTLVMTGHIYGSGSSTLGNFAWSPYPTILTNGEAFPAMSVSGGAINIDHLVFSNTNQNGGLLMYGTNLTNLTIDNTFWSSSNGGNNDYKSLHAVFLVTGVGSASFNNNITKTTFSSGVPGGTPGAVATIGRSDVPSFIYEALQGNCTPSNIILTNIWTLARSSIDFDNESSTCGGGTIKISQFSMEDNYEPGVQITGLPNGITAGWDLQLDNLSCFDLPTACVWYYPSVPSFVTATVTGPAFNNANSYPFIGGGLNVSISGASFGFPLSQNVDFEGLVCGSYLDGLFSTSLLNLIQGSTCQKQMKENVQIGPGQNIFEPRLPVVGPTITCSTLSGTVPAGTYTVLMGLAEPMGGEGGFSLESAPCTLASPGNISIDWSATALAAPGVAGWELYYKTSGAQFVLTSASVPGFPPGTTSYLWNSGTTFAVGVSPNLIGAGNNGFNNKGVFGSHLEAGFVPGNPCQTSLGVDVPGCIAQLQSSSVPQGAPGVETSRYDAGGVQRCTNNGNPEVPCVTGGGGGGTSIVAPPTPQFIPLTPQVVFNTPSASVNANISATNLVSFTNTIHQYKFEWVVSLTTPGTSCVGSTTVVLNAIYTNPSNSTPVTQNVSGTITLASSGNGTAGFIASGVTPILAAPGTAVQYSTSSFTGGGSCSPNPKYQVQATLVQEF